MASDELEALLEEWAAALSAHDVERLVELFAEDCVHEDVTLGVVNRGREEVKAFAEGVFTAFPDFRVEQTARFAAGGWGGAEWAISGTHLGQFPGIEPTGKSFSIRGASVFELSGGRIRRNSDYYGWDMAAFLRQQD